MTLSRKLIILVSMLFLSVFVGALVITVNKERSYLVEQLGSHAQDAATALGMTLGPAIHDGDTASVMSFVSAMADGGYYQRIRILDQKGHALADEQPTVAVKDVPSWFLNLVPLAAPERSALVTSGWQQAGTVLVRSHPGYAYRELWHVFVNMSAWFFFVWLASVLLVSGFVRYVLRPLESVEHQALAIADGRFPPAQKLPDTRELKRVVMVMNKMSERVESMIGDKTELIRRMERELYEDAVTGFSTRDYFEAQLRHMLEGGELYAGALFLMRLHDFGGYNDRYGFLEGNTRLQTAAQLLRSILQHTNSPLFSRFGGAELAAFVPLLTEAEAGHLGDAIKAGFEAMADEEWPVVGHLGIALSGDGDMSTVFSKGDMALRVAQAKGANAWHQFAPETLQPQDVRSADEWRKLLSGGEIYGHIVLNAQPVASCHHEGALHYEILARMLSHGGAQLPASIFMPIAKRMGAAENLDRVVVSKALSFLDHSNHKAVYSLNLSMASITSPGFRKWLTEKIHGHEELARQLILELPFPETDYYVPILGDFIKALQPTGCGFLLDRCLMGTRFPECLGTIPVKMVKLDGSYAEHIGDPVIQRLLEAVKDVTRARGVMIIATRIETQQQGAMASQLGFDGIQGELTGLPYPIETDLQEET